MGNDHQMYSYDFVRDMLNDICIEVKRSVQVLHHHVLGWGSDDVDNEGGGSLCAPPSISQKPGIWEWTWPN